ncbi:hypothetical protein FHL15_005912 [Xylaria flabelliformis]|uniref:Uncharacterized protein n=1 Tax=Xylaria flabelliformis TaxID=2512241 RepID=A0A553HZG0_9PEZI|nr:hypothetical protein FHL15_005912 [Xylaria flabelliformis]
MMKIPTTKMNLTTAPVTRPSPRKKEKAEVLKKLIAAAETEDSDEDMEAGNAKLDYNNVTKELETYRKEISDLTTELEGAKKGSFELEEKLKTLQGAQMTHRLSDTTFSEQKTTAQKRIETPTNTCTSRL